MILDDFRESLTATEPPAGLTLALVGLWWDAKGDWTRAHESAQQDEGPEGSWVHAYLHRKEGDQSNAAYWYGRAGKPVCREPLDTEWLSIAKDLLGYPETSKPISLSTISLYASFVSVRANTRLTD
jgi:hypothetical protein